jgi:hypothetical protein
MARESGFQSQEDRKQKQKVILLAKRLAHKEKELLREQEETDSLRLHLSEAELDLIELELGQLEKKWEENPRRLKETVKSGNVDLFLDEREKLYRFIQSGPYSYRARALLDRILQLITQLGDV